MAPRLYIEVDTGITPHEQSGIGTPKIDAFKTDINPGVPTFLVIISLEVNIYKKPETINPRIKYGAISTNRLLTSFMKSFILPNM